MSEARRRPAGLGRGLNALLGDAVGSGPDKGAVRELPIRLITRNAAQPRRHFDEDAMNELAQSIGRHGVLQPIVVRELPAGNYQIIAGERRWRAAQIAHLHAMPAIVRAANEEETLELAIIENIQREQLNAIEEGEAYRRLIDEFGHKPDALGKTLHKSRSHVANLMRLLDLPAAVRAMVAEGQLSMGHARALLGVENAEALARKAIDEGLSVREIEKRARAAKRGEPKSRGPAERNPDIVMLERQLADLLGLRVEIAHEGKGGRVSLDYATLDQLDMICQRLSGERI